MFAGAEFWNDPMQTLTMRVVGFCGSNWARSAGADREMQVRLKANASGRYIFSSPKRVGFSGDQPTWKNIAGRCARSLTYAVLRIGYFFEFIWQLSQPRPAVEIGL